jgi:hypothetical protein
MFVITNTPRQALRIQGFGESFMEKRCYYCDRKYEINSAYARNDLLDVECCSDCAPFKSSEAKLAKRKAYKEEVMRYYMKHKCIPLKDGYTVKVDEDQLELLLEHRWYLSAHFHAITNVKVDGKWKQTYMEDFLLPHSENFKVGFKNGDTLDCRVENLEIVPYTPIIKQKTSDYRGVSYHKPSNRWFARIKKDGKVTHIGTFSSEIACANAYNHYATELLGGKAKLNQVPFMREDEWLTYKTT